MIDYLRGTTLHILDLPGARLCIALLLLLGAGTAQAAQIYVDGVTCQLSEAITAANTDSAQFGCAAGSGADTLILTRGVKLQFGTLPIVSSDITIQYGGFAAQDCHTEDPPADTPVAPATDTPVSPATDTPVSPATDTPVSPPTDTPTDPPGKTNDDPTPTNDPNFTPDPNSTPTDDPNSTRTPDPNSTSTPDPNSTPPVDPNLTPPVDPNLTQPVDPNLTPPADPNLTPPVDPNLTPPVDPNLTPTVDPNLTPTVDPNLTPTVDPNLTPTNSVQSSPPTIPEECIHVVARDETLYRIALRYNFTVREISSFNKLLSDDRLLAGQVLILPYDDCLQFASLKG